MDDKQILELFWRRSEKAIGSVSDKYGSMCRGIALNLLRNDEDAEECVNDTYHALWDSIPPQRPEKLVPYIAKITRKLAMKRLTYRNAAKRGVITVPFEELDQCIPDGKNVEDMLAARELTRVLEQFLKTLDADSRRMFLCRYWFFDSIREIAGSFGVSEGTVKTRLYRIRKDLKNYLAKEADIYVG